MIVFPLSFVHLNNRFNLPVFDFGAGKTIGQLLVLIGIVVLFDCFRLIKKIGGGTPVPFDPPKSLITKGLYQFSRNPMFLGTFFIVFGEFLYLGHLLLFFYFLLFVLSFHLYVVRKEEPELRKRFGKEYEKYCEKTPRWLFKKSIPEIVRGIYPQK